MKADVPKDYRLISLQASNVKKLKAIAIKIDGAPIFKVSGRNEMGKSSVLDVVTMAIGGPRFFPKEPIRKGQDEAEMSLDFGALQLTRKIWRKEGTDALGSSLSLKFADGRRPKEKQTELDALRGSTIADDPIEFAHMDPKKRYNLLRGLVPGFDFDANAELHRTLFEERTDASRDLKKAIAAAEAIVVPLDAPASPVDITKLSEELTRAFTTNNEIDQRARRREEFEDNLESMRDRLDTMRAEVAKLEAEIVEAEGKLCKAEPLPAKIDVTVLQLQMNNATALNQAYTIRANRQLKDREADALQTEVESLSSRIADLDRQKVAAIENAKLPIERLTFGDDDIMLDGLPFDQASTARKIRVSTALLMALKPDLRVLLVREGSLLDKDARAALEADAREHNFVVLMETVGEEVGDGAGVVIEDGEVR